MGELSIETSKRYTLYDTAGHFYRIAKELKLDEADEAAYIIYEQFEQQQLEARLKDILG